MQYIDVYIAYKNIYAKVPIQGDKELINTVDGIRYHVKYKEGKIHELYRDGMLAPSTQRYTWRNDKLYVRTIYPSGIETTPTKVKIKSAASSPDSLLDP